MFYLLSILSSSTSHRRRFPRRLSPMIGCPGWAPPTRLRPSWLSLWWLTLTPHRHCWYLHRAKRNESVVGRRLATAEAGRVQGFLLATPRLDLLQSLLHVEWQLELERIDVERSQQSIWHAVHRHSWSIRKVACTRVDHGSLFSGPDPTRPADGPDP